MLGEKVRWPEALDVVVLPSLRNLLPPVLPRKTMNRGTRRNKCRKVGTP